MYNHKEIEKKWQKYWVENKTFKIKNDFSKPKYYTLDMFPFPSGAGLHVGHPEGMTANDIIARYKNAKGFNVLHPIGWDAFGLPAENYAIKTGTHPKITTQENINNFRKQIKSLGFSYDWDREVNTTDPDYYKWTQWIFLKLYEKGLAYEQDLPINYCPSCKTGLANEEVLNDFSCERCGEKVEKKKIRQWVLAITKYADRLLTDIDKLDWPEGLKEMQRNWIGKSEGCEFKMKKAQKNKNGSSNGSCLNDKAKFLYEDIIFQNIINVKKKSTKKDLNEIFDKITVGNKEIIFNGKNINKHFNGKNNKDVRTRKKLANTVCSNLNNLYFINDEIGFLRFNNLIIKISLGKQFNGTFFVKSYYIDNKLTKQYKIYSEENKQEEQSISVYTTRIDTVFGMTYAVLAPDHKDVHNFITPEKKEICEKYILDSSKKSDQDRTQDDKEKTGVFTGSYVINPFNGKEVPLWIGDYVLGNYGTGAVMAVPAHDERDFEFAKKYNLEIVQSVAKNAKIPDEKKPRKGVETLKRDIIDIILENDKGEFLLQTETAGGVELTHFVGGGIDEGDSELKTVGKELTEETGYTDFEIIGPINMTYARSLAYRFTKEKNQDALGRCFYIKLKSDNQIKSEVDEGKHTIQWVKKEDVAKNISWPTHSYLWDIFANGEKALTELGTLVNSGEFTGLDSKTAQTKLIEFAEKNGFGEKKVNYKLRDWLFSRQRYWGEPIPLIHLEIPNVKKLPHISDISEATDTNLAYILKRAPKSGEDDLNGTICPGSGMVRELVIGGKVFSKIRDGIYGKIVCDYSLPLELPEVEKFEPAGDGQSPLATVESFVNVKLADNLVGKRETNTMPQWGGSCWYYLRYMNPDNKEMLVDREVEKYWGQVDSYVGGAEHAVLHLLYARFWHKFLFDIGVVSNDEPFYRLRNQGLITAYSYENSKGKLIANDLVKEKGGKYFDLETGEELKQVIAKMSKSLKNVINPDDIVEEYGADSLRLYEMYMSEFKDSAPWDTKSIIGVRRFLDKVERAFTSNEAKFALDDNESMKLLNKTIKKVEEDIENYKFNTAIATMMILVNYGRPTDKELFEEWKYDFIKILSPFAPHLAEELFANHSKYGNKGKKGFSVFHLDWPEVDETLLIENTITIAIQVLGKVRGTIEINKDEDKNSILEKAKNNPDVSKWLEGKEIIKEIYVPGKIVNLVVK